MDYSYLPVSSPPSLTRPINITEKLLMGPGPSNCSPRVLEACRLPVIGHMHKEFFELLDEIKAGLQYAFQTTNPWTLAISGPGHLAMEASIVNLLEPGDSVLVGVNGIWGQRASDLVHRLGGIVHTMEKSPGQRFTLSDISENLQKHRPKILFMVHSESSSGVMQPLEGVGDICRSHGVLLVVDCVASLGGVPFSVDLLKIDVAYTGSQKVLASPPGVAPITFGPRARDCIKNRRTPIKSFLLDMNLLANYWGCNDPAEIRQYHHTPPTNLLYGLREGLSALAAEKLQNTWNRHAACAHRLYLGLEKLGLELFVSEPTDRLPTVTTVKIPQGVDWKFITQYAMDKYQVELAGGLGSTVGLVWRIGLMGYNAYPGKVDRVLQILKESLEISKLHGRL